MKNCWEKLNKTFLAMAPMAGITDSPFRQMCKKFGADVVYSEMASATALFYDTKPRRNLVSPDLEKLSSSATLDLLRFEEVERPYVVQLFGAKPEHFAVAAQIIEKEIKPDGIDINFGCPVKKVQKQGAGAVLMGDKKLAKEIIKTTIKNTSLPVSIKTRIKVGEVELLEFLDFISDLDIKALMIHGRTLKQMFSGPIDTSVIKKARDYFGGVIMANGGIDNYEEGVRVQNETDCDGLGIARGAMGKPWLFKCLRTGQSPERSLRARYKEIIKHMDLIIEQKGEPALLEFRKHLAWYVQGLEGAKKMRQELMKIECKKDVVKLFREYVK
jgi:tRNA-dihydrouridine synthase B